jgi:hypothetical protein
MFLEATNVIFSTALVTKQHSPGTEFLFAEIMELAQCTTAKSSIE